MIRTFHLTKNYGRFRAVTDVNLKVNDGEVFGFLGLNGAGKTTVMRMLIGLLRPTYEASRTAIRNVLKRHSIVPAPVRSGSIGWRRLMTHYKEQILACDFFTMETIRLKTLYVFFFIELATRRIHLAGITANPDGIWVAQPARQLIWRLDEKETPTGFLIRDNDRKYTQAFDTLFRSEGIHIISIPYQAPNANSYAE